MSGLRKLRDVLVTTVFAGAVMTATSLPAYAYWIYHYDGAFASAESCEQARQEFIRQNTEAYQPFSAGPCAYREVNPETNSGPAGWYYRWGIAAD
jgi:hypothetical protein